MDPEISAGADASADHVDVSANDQVVSPPNPISTENEPAPAPKKGASIDDALDRAAAKVEAKAKDPKDKNAVTDPAKPVKSEQPRDNGKFAKDPAKDPADKTGNEAEKPSVPAAGVKPAVDPNAKPAPGADKPAAPVDPNAKPSTAPARFSADAKAVWDTAPEPVKAEVARMERELTQGIEKHRKAAERDQEIAPFHEMAEKHGTDVKTALTKYTNMETLLRQNPLKGIEAICDNIGVSLRDVARIVLQQPADEASSQSDATIRDLRQKNTTLEERLAKVEGRFQQDDQNTVFKQVEDWAADKPHFELLAPHIANEMRIDRSLDLDGAYQAVLQKHPSLAALSAAPADKEKPDPKTAASAAAAKDDADDAQTVKGAKSINGAPSPGSNPAAKKRSKSIDDAIEAAFAAAG